MSDRKLVQCQFCEAEFEENCYRLWGNGEQRTQNICENCESCEIGYTPIPHGWIVRNGWMRPGNEVKIEDCDEDRGHSEVCAVGPDPRRDGPAVAPEPGQPHPFVVW